MVKAALENGVNSENDVLTVLGFDLFEDRVATVSNNPSATATKLSFGDPFNAGDSQ